MSTEPPRVRPLDYATPQPGRRRPIFRLIACGIAAVFWTGMSLATAHLLVVIFSEGLLGSVGVGVVFMFACLVFLIYAAGLYWLTSLRLFRACRDDRA
ncbi:MAG TPA: hypothetical protein VEA69_19335 [Tepidisphaeraceae bacterium]|nr:hypothetical protein [Tepidisphaeraceae bacterium]